MTADEQRAVMHKSRALADAAVAASAALGGPAAPPPAMARALPLGSDRQGTSVWRLQSAPALTGAHTRHAAVHFANFRQPCVELRSTSESNQTASQGHSEPLHAVQPNWLKPVLVCGDRAS